MASTPSNLSLSGTILSWTNSDVTSVTSYMVYNWDTLIATTSATTFFVDLSSGIVAGSNALTVRSFHGGTQVATSAAYTFTPSAPSNLSLSGTILSWTNSDSTGVTSYMVNNRGALITTTSATTFSADISSILVDWLNDMTVVSFNGETQLATSDAYIFTSPAPSNLSLSGTILSWTHTDSLGVSSYMVYNGDTLITTTSATTFSADISSMVVYASNGLAVLSLNREGGLIVSSDAYIFTPSAPSNLSLSGTILSWTNSNVAFVTSYMVYNGGTLLATTSATTFSADISSGVGSGSNPLTVLSFNGENQFATSAIYWFIPSAPSNLSLSGTILSWTNSDVAFVTSYRIYRGGTLIATTSATTFFADLSSGIVSGFNALTVRSFHGGTRLATSAAYTFTPPVPSDLSISGTILSWTHTDSRGVTSYRIFFGGRLIATTSATTFFADLSSGIVSGSNSLTVGSFNGETRIAISATYTFTPSASAPSNLSLSGTIISWTHTDSRGVTSYRIYNDGALIATTSATTFSADISSMVVYAFNYLTVGSFNGETRFATSATYTFASPAPSNLSLSGTILSWTHTDSIGVTSYMVYNGGTPITTTSATTFSADISSIIVDTINSLVVVSFHGETHLATSAGYTFTSPSPSNLSLSGTILSWTHTDSLGVFSYMVYNGETLIATTSAAILFADLSSGIVAGSNSLAVFSLNREGGLIVSSDAYIFTPTIPSNLSLSGTILSWTNSDPRGVTSYMVYNNGTLIATTSATTFSADISSMVFYAFNELTVGSFHGETQLATSAAYTFTPSAPSIISLSGTILSWTHTDSRGVTSYRIYRGAALIATTSATTFFADLSSGIVSGSNALTVRSFHGETQLATSAAYTFTPSAPSIISLSGTILSWTHTDSRGVTSYRIYRGAALIATTSATTFFADLSSGIVSGSNALTVRSFHGGTQIAISATYTFTPSASAPSNLSLSGTILSWTHTDSRGVTSYMVYNHATLIATTTATTFSADISSIIVDTINSLVVVSFHGETQLATSAGYTFTSPAPSNLSLSGTILSWTHTDSLGVSSYMVYNGGTLIATTSAAILFADLSSGIVAGSNDLVVVSYNREEAHLAASVAYTFTPSAPPHAPTLSTTVQSPIDVSSITFHISGEVGTTYRLFVDGVITLSGSIDVSPVTVSVDRLADGSHVVSANLTDAAGNVSASSNTVSFVVDTVPPHAPTLSTTAQSPIDVSSITFHISGEVGTTYRLFVDGMITLSGSIDVSPVTVSVDRLADGSHDVSANLTDAFGRVSASSNTVSFVVDTVPPHAPTLSTTAQSPIYVSSITFHISGEVGTTYRLFVDGVITLSGSIDVSPVTVSVDRLADGSHDVSANLTDAFGRVSASSNTVSFVVDIGGGGGGGPGPGPRVVVPCFLGTAPVLTPTGYTNLSNLAVGDCIQTADGRRVTIQRVLRKSIEAGPYTNPYIIPKGHYGATQDLPISPNHRVAANGSMVEARLLGLRQQEHASGDVIEYYNLELPDWEHDNMVVAGVVVESLAPVRRITMTIREFKARLIAKYGKVTPAILALVEKTCRILPDGRVDVPAIQTKRS